MEDKELVVHTTKDYSLFKELEGNRTIGNIKLLKQSIEAIDMTPYVPIIVDKDMRIVDGQNRYTVCKELDMPIYYIKFNGDAERAMIALNTVLRPWKQGDWLHYYVQKGYPAYSKLEAMIKETGVNISNGILLFSQNHTNSTMFKRGNLTDESEYFIPTVEFLNSTELPIEHKTYRAFVNATMLFLIKHDGDNRAINKLRRKIIACPKFSKIADYLNTFENLLKK